MLPLLLYMLFKKIPKDKLRNIAMSFLNRKNRAILIFIILLLLASCVLFSQSQLLRYNVSRNGSPAGWVKLDRNTRGNISIIHMTSEIRVRMVFLFTIISSEYVETQNEKLLHTYVFRKVNGTVKTDMHTRWSGNSYEKEYSSKKEKLDFEPASFNVLDLYFREPSGIEQVYSGSQQQNLRIEKKQAGVYKLHLPGGDSNAYYYTNGICTKVKIDHSFYSAEFVLAQP